jgi:hypothetical protein
MGDIRLGAACVRFATFGQAGLFNIDDMTLISMINGLGFPVIVSDRAISAPGTRSNVVLPTTNRQPFSDTPVIEFRVKSVIIREILCVAFAGNVSAIEKLYGDIDDFFLHRPVNVTNLRQLLDGLEYDRDVSFLIALGGPEFTDNRVMVVHTPDFATDDTKEDLDIISAGSGAKRWTEYFVANAGYLEPTGIRSLDSKQRALLACISFVSHEQYSTRQLEDGWGGGFDIVYYDNGRFQRYDQVTWAIYAVNVDQPERLQPLNIIHNSYGDHYAISRNLMTDNPKIWYIPEFRNRATPPEGLTMDCTSHDVVSAIFLHHNREMKNSIAVFVDDPDPNALPLFHTTVRDGKFGVQFRPVYIDKVKEAVRLSLS